MTRLLAYAAPALMLAYGVCRWADGLDGDRGNGPAWTIGHVAFWVAIMLFTILADRLRRALPGALATAATVTTALGALGFLLVITHDLSDAFPNPPAATQVIGPVLFELGLLTLLVRHVVAGRLPLFSPIVVLLGFAAIPVNLDLLPLASLLVGVGLLPLALRRVPTSSAPATHAPIDGRPLP
jgi:hypothetical protein